MRSIVPQFGGAEVKTEGDSFYVVFPSASGAVMCGLSIAAAASAMTAEDPSLPLRVGIGIHAGETAETSEGYVGSAVNLASRVCAIAAAGEVLVTDTVRSLTRTSSELQYVLRGRKHLKGIPEPVTVYAARNAVTAYGGSVDSIHARRGFMDASNRIVRVSALIGSLVVVLVLGTWIVSRMGQGGLAAPTLPSRTSEQPSTANLLGVATGIGAGEIDSVILGFPSVRPS